jgi:hypothetical protein
MSKLPEVIDLARAAVRASRDPGAPGVVAHSTGGGSPGIDDGLDEVAVEAVSVGDFVCVGRPRRPAGVRCVIAKRATSNTRSAPTAGWLVELSGGEVLWLSRGERLWRRRIG